MSVLIIFIKLIAVFDLLVIAVYFGGDILSTMLNKLRRKPKQDDPFDFSLDTVTVSLSIDSIRHLYSGDAADFVEEKILPNAEKTMAVLTEQEQTATRLLLSALIGFLAAEAPMDEQSFPLMMELLNCMEGEKEDGCQDAVDSLLEDAACNTRRHEEYYSNYQRYQLMQVDKTRVILACRIIINDLLGKLYRYDYRFGYIPILLPMRPSMERWHNITVRIRQTALAKKSLNRLSAPTMQRTGWIRKRRSKMCWKSLGRNGYSLFLPTPSSARTMTGVSLRTIKHGQKPFPCWRTAALPATVTI